ncbi:response regulator transcription factor [Streptococcus sp. DD13]|uniref:response regulator transcription factor n=1 Tax=Streptococcus sp. DD13 TaxID=1777881 RepID=UPI00079B338D|nr:response regulator transcription factor [Streptococcus sp. DD13]KXT78782.1 Two-component response regulator YvcP [Streptococcus sp. DD13]
MRQKEKIFIVEDDASIVSSLKNYFSPLYQVESVRNFRAVRQEVVDFQPDLVLMDISLPYFNGFYWTTEIRKELTIPIIFISSSSEEMDAIMAMNMGGDDFISKPFSLALLDAKIGAFLRRAYHFSQQELTLDQFKLSFDGSFSNGEEICALTKTETKILTTLFQQLGKVVAKEELLDKLWEGEEFIDQNTLSVHMTRLRKKVSKLGFERIHTIRGVGYLVK